MGILAGPDLDRFLWRLESIFLDDFIETFGLISKLIFFFETVWILTKTNLEFDFLQILGNCIVQFYIKGILYKVGWGTSLNEGFSENIWWAQDENQGQFT